MSYEISSFYRGSSLKGIAEELQLVKAIGRAPSVPVGELVQLVNQKAKSCKAWPKVNIHPKKLAWKTITGCNWDLKN